MVDEASSYIIRLTWFAVKASSQISEVGRAIHAVGLHSF